MKVNSIESKSLAAEAGIRPGDEIIAINGEPVRDPIDYRFHSSDEFLAIEVRRDNQILHFEIEKDYDEDLGIIFEDIQYRHCGNKCIFCFVDQNPPGMRQALYFKDEDFRLSFIYGNYVTLTNISKNDLNRIVKQRLSPLYISVHATDIETRKYMLGIRGDDRLLEKIKFLAENRIEIHAQIVLCPGINDGKILDNTISDLAQFYPALQSIAIVPLGLTRHRENLPQLRPVTPDFCQKVIEQLEPRAISYKRKLGQYLIYIADEFYLQAKMDLPEAERYDEFPQIENGIGMTRQFIEDFKEQIAELPHRIKQPKKLRLVTGKSAEPMIKQEVADRLKEVKNLLVEVVAIHNHFYGEMVTVTGLLTAQDILGQLKGLPSADLNLLPNNCVNYEGIFLDDMSPLQLQEELGQKVKIFEGDWSDVFSEIEAA